MTDYSVVLFFVWDNSSGMDLTAEGGDIHCDDGGGAQGLLAIRQPLMSVVRHDMVKSGCFFVVVCNEAGGAGAHDALIAHAVAAGIGAMAEQLLAVSISKATLAFCRMISSLRPSAALWKYSVIWCSASIW